MSCNQSTKDSCGSAWIGGEVVNPKKDYVIISQSRRIIDTVLLNDQNFFIYQMKDFSSGVYNFIHNEYQALYIEPGDSIMFRVNTLEFDESLSYTGKGAAKNNFMMDLFLLNELENESMPSMYLLSPAQFEQKMDSFTSHRRKLYNEFVAKKNPSEGFKVVANAAIDYDIYLKKELYISANARKKIYSENVEIPDEFYNYREHVNFGNDELRTYYPYYRYLRFYLDNLAYEQYEGEEPYNRNSFLHNHYKNKLIDSLITNEHLKNSLLRTGAHLYLLRAKNKENAQVILDQFLQLNSNPADHEEITKFATATIRLMPGNTIPNVMLLTSDNTAKDLHSIFNRPTVLYFWSGKSIMHYRNIHTRAGELSAKYPEYDFIGINTDTHFKKWLKVIKNSGYDVLTEYQFEDFKDAEMKLIIDPTNKAMIVDKQGKILNGNINIFDVAIEEGLLGFLNE